MRSRRNRGKKTSPWSIEEKNRKKKNAKTKTQVRTVNGVASFGRLAIPPWTEGAVFSLVFRDGALARCVSELDPSHVRPCMGLNGADSLSRNSIY